MGKSSSETVLRALIREEIRRGKIDEIDYVGRGGGFGYTGGGYLSQLASGGVPDIIRGIAGSLNVGGIARFALRNTTTILSALGTGAIAWAAASHTDLVKGARSVIAGIKSRFSKNPDFTKILPPEGSINPGFLSGFTKTLVDVDDGKANCDQLARALETDVNNLEAEIRVMNSLTGIKKLEKVYSIFANADVVIKQDEYNKATKGMSAKEVDSALSEFASNMLDPVSDQIVDIIGQSDKTKPCISKIRPISDRIRSLT